MGPPGLVNNATNRRHLRSQEPRDLPRSRSALSAGNIPDPSRSSQGRRKCPACGPGQYTAWRVTWADPSGEHLKTGDPAPPGTAHSVTIAPADLGPGALAPLGHPALIGHPAQVYSAPRVLARQASSVILKRHGRFPGGRAARPGPVRRRSKRKYTVRRTSDSL